MQLGLKSLCHLLKGKFSSGLEGASAINYFGDLIGKQPCRLMYNNHSLMKIKSV